MIYFAVLIFLLLLILPVIVRLRVIISEEQKRLFFSISVFNRLTVLTGYIGIAKNRAVLHYNKNKTKVLPYRTMLFDGQKADLLKSIDILKIHGAVIIGGETEFSSLFTAFSINELSAIVYSVLKEEKPYINFKNDVINLSSENGSSVLCEAVASLNLAVALKIFIKKFIGGIKDKCQKKNLKTK